MANALPNRQSLLNGNHSTSSLDDAGRTTATSLRSRPVNGGLAYWENRPTHPAETDEPESQGDSSPELNGAVPDADVERLHAENEELRQTVRDLQRTLEEAGAPGWAEQQREYENLLEEKSEVIRALHQKLQELQQKVQIAPTPREEELIALSDELDRERCRLQQERRSLEQETEQLKEDEAALMQQMREMEIGMSRERAELARQRNELQRLHADIRHELELAARDATLRERLMPLQRRHHEMLHRKGAGGPPPAQPQGREPQPQAREVEPAPKEERSKDSGLLKRFFGSGGR
jgi:hypothetical protein